jgi:hypothetical protein
MRKDQAKIEDRFSVKLIKFLEEKLVKRLELGKRKLLQVAILNHKEDVIDSQQYSSLGEQVVHIDQYLSNSIVVMINLSHLEESTHIFPDIFNRQRMHAIFDDIKSRDGWDKLNATDKDDLVHSIYKLELKGLC